MRILALILVLGAAVLVAQASDPGLWDIDDARDAVKIEMQVDKTGYPIEIEFHITPDMVPANIRAAMDGLFPGGGFTGAEKERDGGILYYELTKTVDGLDVEAMFTIDGDLYSAEVEVPEAKVPDAVKNAIRKAYAGGKVTAWEEIQDGAQELVEYHVKLALNGKNYKVKVSTQGVLRAAYLEVPAEIEVPVPLPR